MNPDPTELGELVAAMATDAIKVQSLWNRAYEIDIEQFRAMTAHAQPDTAELLRALAPSRMLVGNFEMTFQVMLTTAQEEALEIRALPINLEFSIRHAVQIDRYSKISFSVEQSPLDSGPKQS
jgi:hypothetical protein